MSSPESHTDSPEREASSTLVLERRDQEDRTPTFGGLMMTPNVEPEYWAYRVKLSEHQAVVGFPKFNTIGIGFAVEEDWNTNLPYATWKNDARVKLTALEIFNHIKHNKGDESIRDEDVVEAIQMVIDAAWGDREGATVDPADMTGPVVSVEHVGLPSPDLHAVASLNTRLALGRILVDYRRGKDDTAGAIDQILALFAAEASPPASHEGPTVSADDAALVAHLRDDAPYQVCDCCGRKTWDADGFSQLCGMPQPTGQCPGKFGPLTFYGQAEAL